MLTIKRAFYWLTMQGQWNVDTEGHTFVWRRYNFEIDAWETKPMSPDELERASLEWSIR